MKSKNKRYVYLAGKIKVGHDATEYRSLVAPILFEHGFDSLDPLRGKYKMPSWDAIPPNEIIVRDLQDINRADVLLAVSMECKDSSFGTPCEVMYAWLQHKPIVLITNEAYLAKHFWVRALCSRIYFVDEAKGETMNATLAKAAKHIGEWYGPGSEQEIYTAPTVEAKETAVCDCSKGECPCDAAGQECGCPIGQDHIIKCKFNCREM